VYFNAFAPHVEGIVNSPGYGADNSWTYNNMRWETGYERLEGGDTVLVYNLGEEPESFNPTYAHTVYARNIVDICLDGLLDVNPYTHEDLPAMAYDWEVVETPLGPGAMNVTFWLRDDVDWQCGKPFTAEDVKFNMEFLRDNAIPRYTSSWENIQDVVILASGEPNGGGIVRVVSSEASQFLLYDFAGIAALLPPPVWGWLDGRPQAEILAYNPAANTSTPTGAGPRFGTADCPTQLYGTGPFVFQLYDSVGLYSDHTANRNFYKLTQDIVDQLADMFHGVGDVTYDGKVDADDQHDYGVAYGASPPDPRYNADADINEDNIVDADDGTIIGAFVGRKREYP
jgi:hypothetical protein